MNADSFKGLCLALVRFMSDSFFVLEAMLELRLYKEGSWVSQGSCISLGNFMPVWKVFAFEVSLASSRPPSTPHEIKGQVHSFQLC